MFNWFKNEEKHVTDSAFTFALDVHAKVCGLEKRIKQLETHLGVEYFNGGKNKPHYRAKRVRKEK